VICNAHRKPAPWHVSCLVDACCRYVWKGLERLPKTIAQIRSENFSGRGAAGVGRAGERREKSLGLLSQRFVQIFVQSPDNHTVPLDTAAEMLLGEFQDER